MHDPSAEFVSEPLEPERGTADLSSMSRGEPGLPSAFNWRGTRYEIAQIAGKWKTSSRERGDLYLRRHWFEIVTTTGQRMTIYCDRQVKNRSKPKARWWLYSMVRASASESGPSP